MCLFLITRLLESERELRKLFPKIVCYDNVERFTVDEEHLRRHALLVMDGIGFAVECLDDVGKLDHFLKMVGKRHYESRVPERVLKVWEKHQIFQTHACFVC